MLGWYFSSSIQQSFDSNCGNQGPYFVKFTGFKREKRADVGLDPGFSHTNRHWELKVVKKQNKNRTTEIRSNPIILTQIGFIIIWKVGCVSTPSLFLPLSTHFSSCVCSNQMPSVWLWKKIRNLSLTQSRYWVSIKIWIVKSLPNLASLPRKWGDSSHSEICNEKWLFHSLSAVKYYQTTVYRSLTAR